MLAPSSQQGCTLGAFVLKQSPTRTPFFVSVWYKGLIIQFEQKAEISLPRYRKKIQNVLIVQQLGVSDD